MEGKVKTAVKVLVGAGAALSVLDAINRLTVRRARGRLSKMRYGDSEWAVHSFPSRYGIVRYKKAGRGAPLLLLHGLDSQAGLLEWDANIFALSEHFTVYSLEFPGFGFSEKPRITYSAYLLATVVTDFLANVVKGSAYVAASGSASGVCLGAHLLAPAYFRRLILISPTGDGDVTLPAKRAVKAMLRLPIIGTSVYNALHSGFRALALAHIMHDPQSPWISDYADHRRLPVYFNPKGARHLIISTLSRHLNTDLGHLLKNADLPIHIVWGNNDSLNPTANFKPLAAAAKRRLTLTTFKNSKSYPHQDEPNEFVRVCQWFFGQVKSRD